MTVIFWSASTLSAQNSTASTLTSDETVVIVRGQRYVLVPEKTFGKIELLTEELPALREENAALKEKDANSEKVIASERRLKDLALQEAAAERRAREASERETEAVRKANAANEQALAVSQARVKELEGKVKKANRRALFAVLAAAASFLLK